MSGKVLLPHISPAEMFYYRLIGDSKKINSFHYLIISTGLLLNYIEQVGVNCYQLLSVLIKWAKFQHYKLNMFTRVIVSWPIVLAGDFSFFMSISGRNVLEAKENLPNCEQISECLIKNTSTISPDVLASKGS